MLELFFKFVKLIAFKTFRRQNFMMRVKANNEKNEISNKNTNRCKMGKKSFGHMMYKFRKIVGKNDFSDGRQPIALKNSIEQECFSTVCMFGCKCNHDLQLCCSFSTSAGGS